MDWDGEVFQLTRREVIENISGCLSGRGLRPQKRVVKMAR